MYLTSDIGNFTVQNGKITDENGKVMDSPPKALVCLGNKEAPSDGPALMFAASGAGYLMKHTSQGTPFDFFLNKHCWCKNNNMQYYLWFGNPQDTSGTFFTKDMAHKNLFPKFLDDRFDFIGGATAGGTEVFINSAISAFKNSEWSRDFAAEWFKNRCGSMDQLSMWA